MDHDGPLRLLAVESATARLSVALLGDEGSGHDLLGERACSEGGHHAEHLLPLIDDLLSDAGCAIGQVSAFAVSIGPGSFTSLRVGLATVKGLAVGSGAPVVAVPTLEVLARGAVRPGDSRSIVPVLDARRGEVYAAVFDPDGPDLRRRIADGLFSPEELAAALPDPCRLVGEGARLHAEALAGESAEVGDALPLHPTAGDLARLAVVRLARDERADPELAPRYVRRAEAEATRTQVAVEDPI